jgi:hypothetical protein
VARLAGLTAKHITDDELRIGFFDALPCHEKQLHFVAGSHRRNQYFLGGVGTGKTRALVTKGIYLALRQPGIVGALLGRTGRDLSDTVLPEFWAALEVLQSSLGFSVLRSYNKGLVTATFENSSQIKFRPYDQVDKRKGLNLAFAGLDEIEYCVGDPQYSYGVIDRRVRRGIPNLRQVFACSTPAGLRGAIEMFMTRIANGSEKHFIQHATCFDNPWMFDGEPCPDCQGAREIDGTKCIRCGGVGLASEYIDALRAGSSKRSWEQEALGRVLKTSAAIFSEWDEAVHVIPWRWQPGLPWVLCVDWGGPAHAYYCAVQVLEHPEVVDGRVLPAGSWIVAYEEKHDQISRPEFRQRIRRFVMDRGLPYWVATDRAVVEENRWIRQALKGTKYIRWCESREEQAVKSGVAMITYMLSPYVGEPRLYVSSELPRTLGIADRGLRGAMLNYQHVVDPRNPQLVYDDILKDSVNDHPVDALRYGIVTSAKHRQLHGGEWLPFVRAKAVRDEMEAA